jgi:hypothetical protein
MQDAFFHPHLPQQQLDMLSGTKSWPCGGTKEIVT